MRQHDKLWKFLATLFRANWRDDTFKTLQNTKKAQFIYPDNPLHVSTWCNFLALFHCSVWAFISLVLLPTNIIEYCIGLLHHLSLMCTCMCSFPLYPTINLPIWLGWCFWRRCSRPRATPGTHLTTAEFRMRLSSPVRVPGPNYLGQTLALVTTATTPWTRQNQKG